MLKLSEYLEACTGYNENPTEENLKKINDFLNALEIREYLPLKDKEIVCGKVLGFLNDDFNAIGIARFLEMHKVLQGLFAYCINMENDLGDILSVSHAIYDTIILQGLYDTIYNRCTKDFDRLSTMIDNALNALNIGKIVETANIFDKEGFDAWEKEMKEIKDTLDSETVKQLLVVATQGTEGNKELVETINEVALDSVKKEEAKTKEKFEAAAKELDSNHEKQN